MAYVSQYTGAQIDTILGGKFSAGTVSAPGINLSDTGTGLYKSATNELGIAVNGAQKVNVNSSGVQVTGGLTVNGVMEVKNAFIFTNGADATISTYDAYNLILKGANAAGTSGKGIVLQTYCTAGGGWKDTVAMYNTTGSSPTLQLVPYTGNVIIGTNTLNGSNAILQVACPISIYNADQANARMIINNTGGQSFHLIAGVNSITQNGFSIYDATHAATRLTIASGGNVSIGSATDNGVGAFQVDGNVTFSQNAYLCGNTSGLDSTRRDMSSYSYKGVIIGDNSATYPSLSIGGSLRASSGLISFHNFNNANNLATTAGVMIQAYGDDATVTNNGMHLAIATRLSGSAITERMRITSTGNVLIGTTTDSGTGAKLQVNGAMSTGAFTATGKMTFGDANEAQLQLVTTVARRSDSAGMGYGSIALGANIGAYDTNNKPTVAAVAGVFTRASAIVMTPDANASSPFQIWAAPASSAGAALTKVVDVLSTGLSVTGGISSTGALTATHGTFSDAVEYGVDITGALLASGKYYSGVAIGTALTPNQRIGIGMVYDSGAPSSSYFHITPYGGTEGSIFKIINSSGNVLIGTTIDNASTALLQVNGLISTTGVITTRTNTTVPNTTATTVLALTDGFYQVFARITAIPPTTHSAVGFISVHNGSAKLVSTTTVGVLALSISGSNLQVTQSIGSAQEVWISAVKMPL